MPTNKVPEDSTETKPDGGYVPIPTWDLGLLWWSYSQDRISLRALRVYLALCEMRMRRLAHALTLRKRGERVDFQIQFSTKEVAKICGLPTKRANAALQELLKFGLLLEFSDALICFARSPSDVALTDEQKAEFQRWFAVLTPQTRVRIPRRILLLAAESPRPALIAVILGACLRCCWRKSGIFTYSGYLSCYWLARRFGLSLRAIQAAKQHLVGLEWVRHGDKISRFGELVTLNPKWHRLVALPASEGAGGTISAGSGTIDGTKSAGVSLSRSLPTEDKEKYQRQSPLTPNPETIRPGIVEEALRGEKKTESPLPPPRLSNIQPEDFQDTGRALELFRQGTKCGLVTDSEHSRLRWMAAIERARTVHARNPAGVFLFVVKGRKWGFLSDGHYDAANRRLKAYLHAPPSEGPALFLPLVFRPVALVPVLRSRPGPSKDALTVQAVRDELARRGSSASVFATLHAHAGFTRERYCNALAELEDLQRLPAPSV